MCTWRSYRYDVWIIIGVLMGGVARIEQPTAEQNDKDRQLAEYLLTLNVG